MILWWPCNFSKQDRIVMPNATSMKVTFDNKWVPMSTLYVHVQVMPHPMPRPHSPVPLVGSLELALDEDFTENEFSSKPDKPDQWKEQEFPGESNYTLLTVCQWALKPWSQGLYSVHCTYEGQNYTCICDIIEQCVYTLHSMFQSSSLYNTSYQLLWITVWLICVMYMYIYNTSLLLPQETVSITRPLWRNRLSQFTIPGPSKLEELKLAGQT